MFLKGSPIREKTSLRRRTRGQTNAEEAGDPTQQPTLGTSAALERKEPTPGPTSDDKETMSLQESSEEVVVSSIEGSGPMSEEKPPSYASPDTPEEAYLEDRNNPPDEVALMLGSIEIVPEDPLPDYAEMAEGMDLFSRATTSERMWMRRDRIERKGLTTAAAAIARDAVFTRLRAHKAVDKVRIAQLAPDPQAADLRPITRELVLLNMELHRVTLQMAAATTSLELLQDIAEEMPSIPIGQVMETMGMALPRVRVHPEDRRLGALATLHGHPDDRRNRDRNPLYGKMGWADLEVLGLTLDEEGRVVPKKSRTVEQIAQTRMAEVFHRQHFPTEWRVFFETTPRTERQRYDSLVAAVQRAPIEELWSVPPPAGRKKWPNRLTHDALRLRGAPAHPTAEETVQRQLEREAPTETAYWLPNAGEASPRASYSDAVRNVGRTPASPVETANIRDLTRTPQPETRHSLSLQRPPEPEVIDLAATGSTEPYSTSNALLTPIVGMATAQPRTEPLHVPSRTEISQTLQPLASAAPAPTDGGAFVSPIQDLAPYQLDSTDVRTIEAWLRTYETNHTLLDRQLTDRTQVISRLAKAQLQRLIRRQSQRPEFRRDERFRGRDAERWTDPRAWPFEPFARLVRASIAVIAPSGAPTAEALREWLAGMTTSEPWTAERPQPLLSLIAKAEELMTQHSYLQLTNSQQVSVIRAWARRKNVGGLDETLNDWISAHKNEKGKDLIKEFIEYLSELVLEGKEKWNEAHQYDRRPNPAATPRFEAYHVRTLTDSSSYAHRSSRSRSRERFDHHDAERRKRGASRSRSADADRQRKRPGTPVGRDYDLIPHRSRSQRDRDRDSYVRSGGSVGSRSDRSEPSGPQEQPQRSDRGYDRRDRRGRCSGCGRFHNGGMDPETCSKREHPCFNRDKTKPFRLTEAARRYESVGVYGGIPDDGRTPEEIRNSPTIYGPNNPYPMHIPRDEGIGNTTPRVSGPGGRGHRRGRGGGECHEVFTIRATNREGPVVSACILTPRGEIFTQALIDSGANKGNYISKKLVGRLADSGIVFREDPVVVCSLYVCGTETLCTELNVTLTSADINIPSIPLTVRAVDDDIYDMIIGLPTIRKHDLTLQFRHLFCEGTQTKHEYTRVMATEAAVALKPQKETASEAAEKHALLIRKEAARMTKEEALGALEFDPWEKEIEEATDDPFEAITEGTQRADASEEICLPRVDGNSAFHKRVKKLLQRYATLFRKTVRKEPAKLPPMKFEIDAAGWRASHPARSRLRPQSVEKEEEIKRQIRLMLDLGVIEECQVDCLSQVLLAKKANGKWRFCIDYRRLNSFTKADKWPLPRIADMLQRIGKKKARWFAAMDMTSGYHSSSRSSI